MRRGPRGLVRTLQARPSPPPEHTAAFGRARSNGSGGGRDAAIGFAGVVGAVGFGVGADGAAARVSPAGGGRGGGRVRGGRRHRGDDRGLPAGQGRPAGDRAGQVQRGRGRDGADDRPPEQRPGRLLPRAGTGARGRGRAAGLREPPRRHRPGGRHRGRGGHRVRLRAAGRILVPYAGRLAGAAGPGARRRPARGGRRGAGGAHPRRAASTAARRCALAGRGSSTCSSTCPAWRTPSPGWAGASTRATSSPRVEGGARGDGQGRGLLGFGRGRGRLHQPARARHVRPPHQAGAVSHLRGGGAGAGVVGPARALAGTRSRRTTTSARRPWRATRRSCG